MRAELRKFDYYTYGLSECDFDYIFAVIERVCDAHVALGHQRIAALRDDPDAVEIVDDDVYYTYLDTVFLWEYALWRLQGIFEGLITTVYLPASKRARLPGLRAKLSAMRAAGYSLPQNVEEQLLEWSHLRNALSHTPPEQYRPVELNKADLAGYKQLLVGICAHWRLEQKAVLERAARGS